MRRFGSNPPPWTRRHCGFYRSVQQPRDADFMREGRVVMSGQSGRYRNVLISGAVMLALGCSLAATPVSAQSLTDRIKGLFGGKPDQPAAAQDAPAGPPVDQPDLNCPDVSI